MKKRTINRGAVHNPGFNYGEFDIIRSQAGFNRLKDCAERTNPGERPEDHFTGISKMIDTGVRGTSATPAVRRVVSPSLIYLLLSAIRHTAESVIHEVIDPEGVTAIRKSVTQELRPRRASQQNSVDYRVNSHKFNSIEFEGIGVLPDYRISYAP